MLKTHKFIVTEPASWSKFWLVFFARSDLAVTFLQKQIHWLFLKLLGSSCSLESWLIWGSWAEIWDLIKIWLIWVVSRSLFWCFGRMSTPRSTRKRKVSIFPRTCIHKQRQSSLDETPSKKVKKSVLEGAAHILCNPFLSQYLTPNPNLSSCLLLGAAT